MVSMSAAYVQNDNAGNVRLIKKGHDNKGAGRRGGRGNAGRRSVRAERARRRSVRSNMLRCESHDLLSKTIHLLTRTVAQGVILIRMDELRAYPLYQGRTPTNWAEYRAAT